MEERELVPLHGIYHDSEQKALFYKKIFDDFPALIWLSRTDGKCWYFNKKWLEFRGRTLEEEFGDGWAEGVHPEDFDRCLDTYLTHFHSRSPFSMEYRLLDHAGEYRWILDMGIPFYGLDQEFEGYIGSCYDVTSEKEMLRDLQISKEAALEGFRARTELMSYVSHEIRTPLSGIIGIVELLARNSYDEETDMLISAMASSSKMLMGLINNLLDLSKFESRESRYIKAPVDVTVIMKEIDRIFRQRIEQNSLAFNVTISRAFPRQVWSDEMKIMQILSNLLGNALKFTDQGAINLSFSYEASNERLLMTVEDTGCGVNQEKQKHMFEEYVQGDAGIFKEYGGTGLGLSIVKTLVGQMGGSIQVFTEIGKGTRFEVGIDVAAPTS